MAGNSLGTSFPTRAEETNSLTAQIATQDRAVHLHDQWIRDPYITLAPDDWPRIPAGWSVNAPHRKPPGEAVRHAGLILTNVVPEISAERKPSNQ